MQKELSGSRFRNSHQLVADAVLLQFGVNRPVQSFGTAFFNVDSWYARIFADQLCQWARLNKGGTPARSHVLDWLSPDWGKLPRETEKKIVIAETPEVLPRGLARALQGGIYHEAWHTAYSRRTPINIGEVWNRLQSLWGLIPYDRKNQDLSWSNLAPALLTWCNIIEDIRIERIGNEEFPGALEKMEELQDLILQQEAEGKRKAKAKPTPEELEMSVILGSFRDLGLGYDTVLQKERIEEYKKTSPKGWDYVYSGTLRPFLDRAIALTKNDSLESLWLGMEVLAAIVRDFKKKKEEEEKAQQGQPQNDPEQQGDAYGEEGESEGQPSKSNKPPLYKVGDKATLTTGPNKGKVVEITLAGIPNKDGIQKLEFRLV